jgi:4-amino-4-deoxy-L-arabinose transferase-like glycosyltransferase
VRSARLDAHASARPADVREAVEDGHAEEATEPPPRPRRGVDPVLLAALAVGFVLRAGWCVYATRRPETFGDPFAYLNHAEDIARGDGYRTFFVGAPTAYYPVGYPALLGGALWMARGVSDAVTTTGVASVVNIAAGLATIVLVYAIACAVASQRVARIAAVVVAVFPGLVLYSATAHYESVLAALVAVVTWLALGRAGEIVPPWPRLVALGAALGVATLVRPIVAPFGLVLLVVWRRVGWRRSVGAVAVVAAVAAVVLIPWSVRSTRAMGGLVLVSTNTGDNLCIGHAPFSKGHYHGLEETCWQGFDDVPSDRLELERDRENTRRALAFARDHPRREVVLLVRKAYYLVEHDHEGVLAVESYGAEPFLGAAQRTALRAGADLFWYAVAVAAAVGGWIAWHRRDVPSRVVIGFVAVLLGAPLAFFGGARFHVPAAPLLALLAAVAVDRAIAVTATTRLTARRPGVPA